MVLPFLKEDAILVFHDTNLHTYNKESRKRIGEIFNLLMLKWKYLINPQGIMSILKHCK